jgi:hypothetical protein
MSGWKGKEEDDAPRARSVRLECRPRVGICLRNVTNISVVGYMKRKHSASEREENAERSRGKRRKPQRTLHLTNQQILVERIPPSEQQKLPRSTREELVAQTGEPTCTD